MAPQPLARVVDPPALAQSTGPRGALALTVRAAWLVSGARLRVQLPLRLRCARCDGGGCDGCGRAGALRCEADGSRRIVELSLSASPEPRPCRLRLLDPLGDGSLAELWLEVRAGEPVTPGVELVTLPASARLAWPRPRRFAPAGIGLGLLVLVAVGLGLWLLL